VHGNGRPCQPRLSAARVQRDEASLPLHPPSFPVPLSQRTGFACDMGLGSVAYRLRSATVGRDTRFAPIRSRVLGARGQEIA